MSFGTAVALATTLITLAFNANAQTGSTGPTGPIQPAQLTPEQEAKWILERLTGVKWPSDAAPLASMTTLVASGNRAAAAAVATSQSQFVSVLVREVAGKMSTREESVRDPLNDFTATIMGVARDGTDARELLHGDFFYKGDQAQLAGLNISDEVVLGNAHYAALERANVNLAAVLVRVNGQQIATNATTFIPNPDPAGVLTSRAFLGAHAIAGTNRRLVEYTFRQFMCLGIQEWADTAAFDTRIGRDVDRAPGGDQTRFLTTCKGCHTVMDGFRGAFARWDARDTGGGNITAINSSNGGTGTFQPDVDGNGVVRKMNRNDFVQYAGGYVTTNDSFINNANRPGSVNAARFGWRAPAPDSSSLAGNTSGVHAFGRLVAGSQRFSQCMAKRAWDSVCKHHLSDSEMATIWAGLGMQLEAEGYSLKKLFEAVAIHPKCRI